MRKKTQKASAAVCSVSSNELNSAEKEQLATIHQEESKMEEKKISTSKEIEENSVPARAEESKASGETVPCVENPKTMSSSEPDEGQLRPDDTKLVNSTRNLYGAKDDETLFAADREFVSSLLAENSYRYFDCQDEFWRKEKDRYHETIYKKLEQADPEELFDDVCEILDISHDFVPTDYRSNAPVHFQNKISDIIDKYNLSDCKVKDIIQVNKTLMLLIDKNNLSEQ